MENEVDKKNQLLAVLSVVLVLLAQVLLSVFLCLFLPIVAKGILRRELWHKHFTTSFVFDLSKNYVWVHFIPLIISSSLALALLLKRKTKSLDFTRVVLLMTSIAVFHAVLGLLCFLALMVHCFK